MSISSFLFTCPIDATQIVFNTFPTGTNISFTVTYENTSKQILNINGDNNAYVTYSGVQTSVSLNASYDAGIVHFGIDGDYSTAELQNVATAFQVVPSGDSALIIDYYGVDNIACFTSGTLISTPTGSTPVQDLHIGDQILNHVGESVPVKWLGRQRFHPAFAGDKLPICIKQGALGNDLPLRDLYVSPGHALYIDNCLLIDAKALVNGTTITQVTQWESDVEYFHIETEHHEIILAEGTAAETFMDNVSRTCFNNYSEYQELYPQAHEMIELDIPRVSHKRQLPNAVKAKLEAIAEVLMDDEKTANAA
jgi:hypothetical protein